MIKNQQKTVKRPPVVVIMGHIDHGKSTLLDYIRKSNSTDKEAGGITQHVSAYESVCEVSGEKRKITFLDTPGHEAFCSIRERSSMVADIAVLVVSVEDGVKPQTKEAIGCIVKDNVPFIVAVNKIDKGGNNLDKIKQNLAENEVLVEGWGGNVPIVGISAKTGEGVNELLEIIVLQADIEDLRGEKEKEAEGFVIESNLNPKEGLSATLIIKDGTLSKNMFVASDGAFAPVRGIKDYTGKNIEEATFSSPVKITGWSAMPTPGKTFKSFKTKDEAQEFSLQKESANVKDIEKENGEIASFPIIVKADTLGSLDAVEHELKKIKNQKIKVKVVLKGVGAIGENDIKFSNIMKSPVIGFNVNMDKSAESLAQRENTEVKIFDIIYELTDYVKKRLEDATPYSVVETLAGEAKVLKIFSINRDKQVIGCRVEDGEISANFSLKIFRRGALIGEGKIKEIQHQKKKVGSVEKGAEFGMLIESKIEISEGDILKAISLVKQK